MHFYCDKNLNLNEEITTPSLQIPLSPISSSIKMNDLLLINTTVDTIVDETSRSSSSTTISTSSNRQSFLCKIFIYFRSIFLLYFIVQ